MKKFKKNGWLDEYPDGGKTLRKPIVVDNPNDPKLRAYNDSLNLYNKNKNNYEEGIETKKRGLKYQNLLKEVSKNTKTVYLEEGTPINIVKKPTQPVVYQMPNNTTIKNGKNVAVWNKTLEPQANPKAKPTYKDFVKTVNQDFVGPDYNLEEAYNNLPLKTMQAWAKDPNKNHLPDTYKLPNHPTFSNESKYYKEGMPAVRWENDKAIPINQPVAKPVVNQQPVYTSQKQSYQGRQFMEATGLRPGLFHPEEVELAKTGLKGKRTFKHGGTINWLDQI